MRRGNLKHLVLTVFMSGFTINAYATGSGLYLGLMGGPATNTGNNQPIQVQNSARTVMGTPKSKQFGSRAFVGYQINQYGAIEAGLWYFTGIKYNTHNVPTCAGPQLRIRDFDLLGKGMFPFGNFNVYGKAGAALVYQTKSGSLNPTGNTTCGKTVYVTKFRPTVSLGASYDLSPNWQVDVSANQIMVGSPANNVITYALGFSYHFVTRYCGQFLCDD